VLRRSGHGQWSGPETKDEGEEDEPVANDESLPPPAGGDASETGVFDASGELDAGDEGDAIDVTGATVDWAVAATVLAIGAPIVPMAVRTPPNVPSEISMVNIQEVRFFLFIPNSVPGPLSRW
jgi:hypothetical protein